jgi:membrane-bound lytic murein transglycosylase MltF
MKILMMACVALLLCPLMTLQVSASQLDYKPDSQLRSFCKSHGCDYQVFYEYYLKNKKRFCDERDVLLGQPDKLELIRNMVDQSSAFGLPTTVAILPIMESSLDPRASAGTYSTAAKGLWQFKPATARDMGLTVNNRVDERLDPKKSTKAGLRYIKWLESKFDGDHNLAVLAYHIGIGRLARVISTSGTRNPWYLSQIVSNKQPSKDYLLKYHAYTVALTGKGCN